MFVSGKRRGYRAGPYFFEVLNICYRRREGWILQQMRPCLSAWFLLVTTKILVAGIDFKAEFLSGSLTDAEPGVAYMSGETYPLFAGTQVGLGDFNGDGFDDMFAISGDERAGNAGLQRLYCVFGQEVARALPKKLSAVDGVNGFVVTNIMHSAFTISDINGDGKAGEAWKWIVPHSHCYLSGPGEAEHAQMFLG